MKSGLLVSFVCLLLMSGACYAGAPTSIAGVTLGANIDQIADKLEMSSAVPLWRSEHLSKVAMKPIEGFRSGYVLVGNCRNQGRVLRVKLSYEDESEHFYDRLHSELSRKFGKPTEWRGNPFGTLKIWKWSLKDAGNNTIGIILERYVGDDDSFTPGNSIRLTHSTLMEEEKACAEARQKSDDKKTLFSKPGSSSLKKDFRHYLPQ